LKHPHIAGIYGLEESDGVSALVMELVDGAVNVLGFGLANATPRCKSM
jgi:hypothetical protein